MGYLNSEWERDHLGREKQQGVAGSLLGRSRRVECPLARKVDCSRRRDDLRGAMYIREDSHVVLLSSSAGSVPRSAHCGRTSY